MEKSLYLLRHSIAEPVLFDKPDEERTLTEEGYSTLRNLVEKLKKDNFSIDYVACSFAKRTTQTAVNLLEQLDLSGEFIHFNENIYNASLRELLKIVNGFSEEYQKVLVVGHNPAISYLSEYLTGEEIGQVNPCGLVNIQFLDLKWEEVSQELGKFNYYYQP